MTGWKTLILICWELCYPTRAGVIANFTVFLNKSKTRRKATAFLLVCKLLSPVSDTLIAKAQRLGVFGFQHIAQVYNLRRLHQDFQFCQINLAKLRPFR